jgi:hypothetical protein
VQADVLDAVFPALLRQIESDSIIVASTFASIIPYLIRIRTDYEEKITKRIIETDKSKSKNRHWQIIKNSIMEAMDQYLDFSSQDEVLVQFIKNATNSSSSKTRKTAKRILKKRNLEQ